MSYHYDIFISVKFDAYYAEWIHEHFIPVFEPHLKNSIIAKCHRDYDGSFYYKKDIEPGDLWRQELLTTIPRSRCIVALCSPEYFRSTYCMIEWMSFWDRGKVKNTSLVVPASIHDGESFPPYAQAIQTGDLSEYVVAGPGFKLTADYPEFVRRTRKLAESAAERVKEAPAFENFSVAGAEHLDPPDEPEIPQPKM